MFIGGFRWLVSGGGKGGIKSVEVCCVWRETLCSCRALKRRREEEPEFGLTLDDFQYYNETPVSTMLSDFMLNASFTGVSVSVEGARHLLTC